MNPQDSKLRDCFDDRKLRKVNPDLFKSKQSIKAAQDKYKEAYEINKAGFPKMAVVLAYASMFHAGRALLYMDGIQEKSHYCLVQYIKENYVWSGKLDSELITTMDHFRGERNDVFYGFSSPNITDDEAKNGMEIARKMIDKVKDLIEQEETNQGDV
jgi:uncharacterized protein (UPF0332 family)